MLSETVVCFWAEDIGEDFFLLRAILLDLNFNDFSWPY